MDGVVVVGNWANDPAKKDRLVCCGEFRDDDDEWAELRWLRWVVALIKVNGLWPLGDGANVGFASPDNDCRCALWNNTD